jgi:hypothetical protein
MMTPLYFSVSPEMIAKSKGRVIPRPVPLTSRMHKFVFIFQPRMNADERGSIEIICCLSALIRVHPRLIDSLYNLVTARSRVGFSCRDATHRGLLVGDQLPGLFDVGRAHDAGLFEAALAVPLLVSEQVPLEGAREFDFSGSGAGEPFLGPAV